MEKKCETCGYTNGILYNDEACRICNKLEKENNKIITNRQWLESLSDEQLAKLYQGNKPCDDMRKQGKCKEDIDCEGCYLMWLKAEHKE